MRTDWMQETADAAPQDGLTRRTFLKAGAVAGGGLVLGFFVPGADKLANAQPRPKPVFQPNAFLRIAPDNSVTVMVNRLEFGQGVQTSLPMLIAEELDCDWAQMRGELAPAADAFKDPIFGIQMTGGSGSVGRSFMQYREIGAAARAMLLAAAAKQWNVAPELCRTANGVVYGPNGSSATYGALADAAMQMPLPAKVALKDARNFAIVGKPVRRLDARDKSTGKQRFGIDHGVSGMKVVVLAHPPVFGAKVGKLDASKAKAVRGVAEVLEVSLDRGARGVAVIADGYWPAKQGRDALLIEWDTSGVEKTDSAAQMAAYKAQAKTPGIVAREADVSKLAGAAHKISATYEFPYLAHAPMEPLNCVIDLRADACTVWAGSQFQTIDHGAIARTAGLKPEQVTLHTMMAGVLGPHQFLTVGHRIGPGDAGRFVDQGLHHVSGMGSTDRTPPQHR
ncbi:MAG TPA: molybdopterin cofactor-binding domain-containing protein, partial [Burkholderiaceae bacterium]